MGYYDEDGEWVPEPGDEQGVGGAADPSGIQADPMAMLLMLANSQGTSAAKPYKGTDPYYFADQASQNVKNLYGLTGINPIEQSFPLGEKGTVPYTPQADYFKQTSDPELQAIYNDMDQGASLAQVQAGLSAGGFSDEEKKAYFESAAQYDKASRTDAIKSAQFDEQRRYADPFGMEPNPEVAALRQQYPTDESYGQQNFGDLLTPITPLRPYQTQERYRQSKTYTSQQQGHRPQNVSQARGSFFAREAERGGQGGPFAPPVSQRTKYTNKTRTVTKQPSANMREQDRLNRNYNDRVQAVMKYTSAGFANKVNSMPRQTPTPGNQNYSARLRAVAALLAGA